MLNIYIYRHTLPKKNNHPGRKSHLAIAEVRALPPASVAKDCVGEQLRMVH